MENTFCSVKSIRYLSVQVMLTNAAKHGLKWLPMKKKRIPVRITSVSAYVDGNYIFTFPAFLDLRINSTFR